MIAIGVFAIVYPLTATLAVEAFNGWMILVGGITQVVHTSSVKSWRDFLWDKMVRLLYVFAGVWFVIYCHARICKKQLVGISETVRYRPL